MKRKGFTLIEITVVVGILSIILAISLPIFSRMRESGREGKTQAELNSLLKAVNMYYGYTGQLPKSLQELNEYISISNIEDKYELNPNLPYPRVTGNRYDNGSRSGKG